MIQKVEAKQATRPVTQAGRLSIAPDTTVEAPREVDPLQANDPWKNYLKSSASAAAAGPSAGASAPRAPAAPTQRKFDQQDERLQKLEAGLAEIQRGHQAMAQQVASTQASVDNQVRQVRTELGSFAQEFSDQLHANAEAQKQAQAQQQLQLQLGLQEIQNLLQASPRRGQDVPKRLAEVPDGALPPMEVEPNI